MTLQSTPSPAYAGGAKTILVLDASGSMWGQIGGDAKITIAQRVIGDLLGQLPDDEALGLYAYGHREKGSCTDIERLVPAEVGSKDAIRAAVNALKPRGKTPLSDSVTMAAEELKYQEDRATVILVSDGRETCEKDPCAVARALEDAGADFTAHVIGFDVAEAEDIRQLSCIAEETGGKFYRAADAGELVAALETVVDTVVAAPKPEPTPEPEPVVVAQASTGPFFVDEFDGAELAEHWQVQNPDPEGYLVDGGQLILLSTAVQTAITPQAENIVTLDRPLPRGDWDAEIEMVLEFKSPHSIFQVGFYDNSDALIMGGFQIAKDLLNPHQDCASLSMMSKKGDEIARDGIFLKDFWGNRKCSAQRKNTPKGTMDALLANLASGMTKVTFSKRGRQYHTTLELPDGTVYESDSLSSLRAPGRLSFLVGNADEGDGETLALIERITAREVTE